MPTDQPARPIAGLSNAPVEDPPPRRLVSLALAAAAGLCWAVALVLMLFVGMDAERALLAPLRLLFYVLVLAAGLLTFVPVQRQLQIPGLAFEGVAGASLLLYTLAFVPPPTGWLLSLPDIPVYLLLAVAVFWTVSAVVTPPVFAFGRRIFHQRARQYDLRRARRQAHEFGLLAALCIGLAGLRLLTPLSVVLLALILVVAELLFLSFVETET